MYDIDFFKNTDNLKNKITKGFLKNSGCDNIDVELESLRKNLSILKFIY